jgi:transcriptional regulator with XRE-family HTH domain
MDIVNTLPNLFLQNFAVPYTAVDYRTEWVRKILGDLRARNKSGAEVGRAAAKAIGRGTPFTRQYINRLVHGEPPSEEFIEGLCKAYNVDPPSPEDVPGVEPGRESEPSVTITKRLYDLALLDNEHYRDLSDRLLKMVEELQRERMRGK